MNKIGLKLTVHSLVFLQFLVVSFRLFLVSSFVKVADLLEDFDVSVDEIINELVFSEIDKEAWLEDAEKFLVDLEVENA